jgi:rubrerythrin
MFSAREVFDIAIQIERNGSAFYRRAIELTDDPESQRELEELALMEDDHEKTFREIKERALGKQDEAAWFDPNGEAAGYLQVIAGSKIFAAGADVRAMLPENAAMKDILTYAVAREQESVLFFSGMKLAVPEGLGTGKIDEIIAQEMGHVVQLTRKLEAL